MVLRLIDLVKRISTLCPWVKNLLVENRIYTYTSWSNDFALWSKLSLNFLRRKSQVFFTYYYYFLFNEASLSEHPFLSIFSLKNTIYFAK
jgi:hypothetical protein